MNAVAPIPVDKLAANGFPAVPVIFERLSLINRWAGNIRFAYSALQHSILVADTMVDREAAIYGLLHEAPKAFLGDPRSPVSDHFNLVGGNSYYQLKGQLMDQLCRSIDIPPPSLTIKSMVAEANLIVNNTEIRDVVIDNPGSLVREDYKPLSKTIQPMNRVDVIINAKARYTMLLDDMHHAMAKARANA